MNLDLEIVEGQPEKPLVILIHGLGMNRHFWSVPEKCQALGGTADLSVFFSESPDRSIDRHVSTGNYKPGVVKGLRGVLIDAGYAVVSWSQRRPVGPVREANEEFAFVLETVRKRYNDRPVVLIGHSRGGLIARHYLGNNRTGNDIVGLVTIGTPHKGSRMADLAKLITPAAKMLQKGLPRELHSDLSKILKRTTEFFTSPAIDELKPGSNFLEGLPVLPAQMPYILFAGSRPHFFDLYYRISRGDAWQTLGFPEILTSIWPDKLLPDEIKDSMGDGLVTVESAGISGAEKVTLDANHVKLAFFPEVHSRILRFLDDIHEKSREDSFLPGLNPTKTSKQ